MEGKLDTTFEPMGGLGATVEVDETYIGKHDNVPRRVKGYWTKNVVLSLVERGGHVRVPRQQPCDRQPRFLHERQHRQALGSRDR